MDSIMGDNITNSRAGEALHELFREVFALHAVLARVMDKIHEQAGLTTPQRKVMQTMNRTGSATVPDIAALLGVSRQSVQVICNDLLSRGLIEFRDNPRHKRSKLAFLTASGRQAYQQAQQLEYQAIEQVLPDIGIENAKAAHETLACIRKALEILSAGIIE
jgi:DNA-binding MarR family transcriptional regulator